jgi:predicted dehydrogenase
MPYRDHQVTMAVIGCGHWGPNHVRVFSELDRSRVIACADSRDSSLKRVRARFPGLRTTTAYTDLLEDGAIDAVVIATPTSTHGTIVREALQAGKDVLVEKPLCTNCTEAAELSRLAETTGRVLMVGHVFLFNPGIVKLREEIISGHLGRILYLDAVRTNLGPIRPDVSALYDLGTHDISIFNYLMGSTPTEVCAQGRCISQTNIEDVCFASLRYPDGTLGHIHVSWLNPRKVRTLTIVGDKKMAHWDDVDPADTLRVYDKGVNEPPYYDSYGEFKYLLKNADVHLPRIDHVEPLVSQANAFLDSVLDGVTCRSGPVEAQAVVAVLEAAAESIRSGGRMCPVDPRESLYADEVDVGGRLARCAVPG